MQPGRAPGFDIRARIRRIEHQHREAVVTGEIIAIEGAEGEMSGAILGDILWRGDGKQFDISAAQLNERIAGAERMLTARRDRKSQSRIVRTHGLEVMAGQHQVIDPFHRKYSKRLQELQGLNQGRRSRADAIFLQHRPSRRQRHRLRPALARDHRGA